MDIQFTEEQELLRSSVQRLLRDQYDFDARRKIVATEEGFSRKHWTSFAELGLLAAPFSEEAGGLGGGLGAGLVRKGLALRFCQCHDDGAARGR